MYRTATVTRIHENLISVTLEGPNVPTVRHTTEDDSREALEEFIAIHGVRLFDDVLSPTHSPNETVHRVTAIR